MPGSQGWRKQLEFGFQNSFQTGAAITRVPRVASRTAAPNQRRHFPSLHEASDSRIPMVANFQLLMRAICRSMDAKIHDVGVRIVVIQDLPKTGPCLCHRLCARIDRDRCRARIRRPTRTTSPLCRLAVKSLPGTAFQPSLRSISRRAISSDPSPAMFLLSGYGCARVADACGNADTPRNSKGIRTTAIPVVPGCGSGRCNCANTSLQLVWSRTL